MNRRDFSRDCQPLYVDGRPLDTSSFTATDAKNEFGQLLEMIAQGRTIVITKHDEPKAVVLPFDEFQNLADRGGHQLDTLRAEFDDLLAKMQKVKNKKGLRSAFDASSKQLGKAAVAAAKNR